MIVHLQEDRAGAGHVSVTLLQVLHWSVVQMISLVVRLLTVMISSQSSSLPGQSPQLAVTSHIFHRVVLLPEVGQLAEQPGQLQLTSPLLS